MLAPPITQRPPPPTGNPGSTTDFYLGLANIRSLKNKVDSLHDHITQHDFDAFRITETWLTNSVHDDVWLQSSPIDSHQLVCSQYLE